MNEKEKYKKYRETQLKKQTNKEMNRRENIRN